MPMNKVTIIENKSEIGAGTRGSSLGIDALKVAALNNASTYFADRSIEIIEDKNHLLSEEIKHPTAIRIEAVVDIFENVANMR